MVDRVGNMGDYMLVPAWLRRRYINLMDWYDKEWQPWFMQMLPKTVAPGRGAKDYWVRPYGADPQGMAKFYGDDEAIEPMNYPHVVPWVYNCRKLGNAFRRNKRTFKEDFLDGIVEKTHAEMMEYLTQWINRSIEFVLTKFAYGELNTINRFTNQNLNRQGVVHLKDGEFNGVVASELGGKSWSNFTSTTPPVFSDLAFLKERYSYMANKKPAFMMIGRKTEYYLEINDDLLDRLIRLKDTTQGVLGEYLMGLNLVKVIGQTYKEIPGADETLEGMPGRGDYLAMDWTNLNKKEMMTEQIGGSTYEWSVIGTRDVGEVKCAWVDEDHRDQRGSPTEMFIEQWEDRNPKQVWTSAQLKFCPEIRDYSNLMLVKAVALQ